MIRAEVTGVSKVVARLKDRYIKGKAKPALVMGYAAPYALIVHEDTTRKEGSKFLEEPLRRLEKQMVQSIEEETKRTRNLEQAIKNGAEIVMEESQKLVPVLTGRLRDSKFIRIE
jgi:hypothetical protein